MTDNIPPPPGDDFELHARKWSAEDRIVQCAWRQQEEHGFDPGLVEDLEEAVRDDDREAFDIALANLFDQVEENQEENQD